MNNELPQERQVVEVNFNGHGWQPAVYKQGEFVDVYGLPLDRAKITGWRASDQGLPDLTRRHKGWT
jgi:hypothetical protein